MHSFVCTVAVLNIDYVRMRQRVHFGARDLSSPHFDRLRSVRVYQCMLCYWADLCFDYLQVCLTAVLQCLTNAHKNVKKKTESQKAYLFSEHVKYHKMHMSPNCVVFFCYVQR